MYSPSTPPESSPLLYLHCVYIPPEVNTREAQHALTELIMNIEIKHPNSASRSGQLQCLPLKTRSPQIQTSQLPHSREEYKAILSTKQPIVELLSHRLIQMVPTYKQKLKVIKPVQHTSKMWTTEAIGMLQDCLNTTDCESMHATVVEKAAT